MLLQPKIHLYMPKYIVVIFRNFSAQNACAKILLRTQRVSVTWLKIGPCLRSRQKEWELDHYLFSSLWHVYLMFVISILENLKGKKIVFWDVTLTRLVPIWGVLPPNKTYSVWCKAGEGKGIFLRREILKGRKRAKENWKHWLKIVELR